ncbi:hypothetical protein BGP79_00050 [Tersicoccus sp. Bi-70]|nr:hypothetical protein BGP79_00050 [Tersicoccus sp. Bi-70]
MIEIKEFAYQSHGAVGAGSTVTVKNNDDTTHTVTADDGSFGVTVKPGESMSFKAPAKPGRYAFHCEFHGNMNGELTVE